jgi:hypothetical protein
MNINHDSLDRTIRKLDKFIGSPDCNSFEHLFPNQECIFIYDAGYRKAHFQIFFWRYCEHCPLMKTMPHGIARWMCGGYLQHFGLSEALVEAISLREELKALKEGRYER